MIGALSYVCRFFFSLVVLVYYCFKNISRSQVCFPALPDFCLPTGCLFWVHGGVFLGDNGIDGSSNLVWK